MNGLFIFHRDFRLEDNKALIELNSNVKIYILALYLHLNKYLQKMILKVKIQFNL